MKKELLHIKNKISQRGFSLVEILVATSVFLVFVISIMNLNVNAEKQLKRAVNSERASQLAQEGLEATRNIRDENFSNLIDGTYGLVATSTQWGFDGSFDVTDIFKREIVISTINDNQKKIDTKVEWDDQIGLNNSVLVSTYLTNWQAFTPPTGLTLQKTIINYFSTKGVNDFADYRAETVVGTSTITYVFDTGTATESPSGTFTFEALSNLTPGQYTVSEIVDSNYTQTFADDCNAVGVVDILLGDSKLCTIINEEKYATLTINKVIDNTGGGTKITEDFAPFLVDSTTVVQGSPTKFPSGTYTVSETVDPQYVQTFSGDCNSSGSISLAIGDSKTCTITNTYVATNPVQQTFVVTALNQNNYRIDNNNDPILTLQRGMRYVFDVNTPGQPFWIKIGSASKVTGIVNAYTDGVTNNGITLGQIIFDVPLTAPNANLYYISQNRSQMSGNINTTP